MTSSTMRWILGLLVTAGAVVGSGAAFRSQPSPEAPPRRSLPVETEVLQRVSEFESTRTYTGVIRAARRSELGFERIGKLVSIAVQEGERVAKGQVLAELDHRNLLAKQRQLQAQRDAANSRLAELIAGPRRQTLDAARALVKQLSADLSLQQADLKRSQLLLDRKAVSQADFERTLFGQQAAAARLDAAQQQLEELEEGTRREKIVTQRAVVAEIEAYLADIAIDIEDSTLRAPFDGAIAERMLDEGVIVSPGSPLVSLVEDAALEAWIGLPAKIAARFQPGQSQQLLVQNERLESTVFAVLPEVNATTRTRTVIFSIRSSESQAAPAQVVRVAVQEQTSLQGMWLPTTALMRGSHGLWSAFAVEQVDGDWIAVRRDVEILHTEADRAFVRGTLGPGDRVITNGAHRLAPGQVVHWGE